MLITTTADWHLRNIDSYGVTDSKDINSFLKLRVKLAKKIIKSTKENDGHLVIAGDFLDDKVVDSITLYKASYLIKLMNELKFVLLLEGNHGYDGKNNKYSVISHWKHLASDNVQIVTYPKVISRDGINYHCIPAVYNIENLFSSLVKQLLRTSRELDGVNVLVVHGPVCGAKFDTGKLAVSGIKLDEVERASKHFDYMVFGDYHRRQQLTDNGWYTGSPMQWTLKDKGQKKGYQVIDTATKEVEFKKLNGIKFLELEWNDDGAMNKIIEKPHKFKNKLKNTVVVLKINYSGTKKELPIEERESKLLKCGAIRVCVDENIVRVEQKKRTTIDSSMSLEEMVQTYIRFKKKELPAKKSKVIEQGLVYLR